MAVGFVYQIGKAMYQKIGELVALTNSKQYLESTEKLNKSIQRLKVTLGTALAPLFNGLTLAISQAVDLFTWWMEHVMAPIYGFLTGLFGAMQDIEDMSMADSTGELADNMEDVADAVEDTGRGLAGFDQLTVLGATQGLTQGIDDISEATSEMELNAEQFERVKQSMLEAARIGAELNRTVGGILGGVTGVFDTLGGWWEKFGIVNVAKRVYEFIKDLPNKIGELVGTVSSAVGGWWDGIVKGFGEFIDGIKSKAGEVWDNITDGAGKVWNDIQTKWNGLGDEIKDFFKDLPGKILPSIASVVTDIENAFQGAVDEITKMFNGISFDGIWNDMTKGFKDAINSIIDMWNSTVASIGWEADILGNKVGINTYGMRIPKLAAGGVVDPNNPMLAMIGDNKNEKEAVAPLSSLQTMIDQAVAKSMASSPYNNKGGAQDITLAIDGRELARVTYDYMQFEDRRRGATIARG